MAESMEERRGQNRQRALDQMERLRDQLQMYQFMKDCEELNESERLDTGEAHQSPSWAVGTRPVASAMITRACHSHGEE